MMKVLFAVYCFVLFVHYVYGDAILIQAKLVGQARVTGRGHSYHATSVTQCLALCNKKSEYCDAVNYFVTRGKCRLLKRCSPITVRYNSTNFYFYSKRPQIQGAGYEFEPESSSCLKILPIEKDYASADGLCAKQNGRLAALTTPALNALASELLKASGAQYAWIGLTDIGHEGNPTHSDGTKVLDRRFFRPAPQHWRNVTNKNCWALQDDGHWAEFSCKKRQLYSVCEVPIF